MPAKQELTLQQMRQMLGLHHDGVRKHEMARMLGVARSTIRDNSGRAAKAGLSWPLAPDLTDDILEQWLFSKAGVNPSLRHRREPDWAVLARLIKRPGANLCGRNIAARMPNPDGLLTGGSKPRKDLEFDPTDHLLLTQREARAIP